MTDRTAPRPITEPEPISRLAELYAHLAELVADATLPIQAPLLDHVELQLTATNIPPLLSTLLPPLTHLLRGTAQDPRPLLSLATKLLGPLSFAQTLAIADAPSLLTALRSPLPGANLLALAVVHKAAASPADAAVLAALPDVAVEVLRRWLESPDVGVAEGAAKVLGDVLETDCDVAASNGVASRAGDELVRRSVPGHARLWRLLLQDRASLALVQEACTLSPEAARAAHAVTISQGRLLRLLPRLAALNMQVLAHSPSPDLFQLPDAAAAVVGRGILQWAALAMVSKSDVLMHLSLIDFFEAFVSVMRLAPYSRDTHDTVKGLVRTAVRQDVDLSSALRTLPDRTVEESEALRRYIADVMD